MPTMEPTTRVTPTMASNPTSSPEESPTSHNGATRTGPSSTTPMGTGTDAADNADVTRRAQSISSGSIHNVITNRCSPLAKQQLDEADYYPLNEQSATEKIKTFTTIGNARPIDKDNFIPTTWGNNPYLWWSSFTDAQLKQFHYNGKVTGYKDMHDNNVHRHHRFHNRPDHCLNLAIHCRWNSRHNEAYGKNKPIHLFDWTQSIAHIRRASIGQWSTFRINILSTSRRHFNIVRAGAPWTRRSQFQFHGLHGPANWSLEH
eukprot:4938286-Amphidinium_carterae.2